MIEFEPIQPILQSIPGGEFVMGSLRGQEDETPPHRVVISPLRMSRFSVTNREYAVFLLENSFPPPVVWRDPDFNHPDQPVVAVSWFDAATYGDWLSRRLGKLFRLPTEAEREYACRAGTRSEYPWGDEPHRPIGGYGSEWMEEKPERVGGPPNAWGLCNMNDNVHEWCLDWYGSEYYKVSPDADPAGPLSGVRRVSRGGSWRHQVKVTRSSARSALDPAFRYTDYSFRLALTMSEKL